MTMPAAKHFDPLLGVDIHIIQPPPPAPPLPIPHPFIGMVIDPMEYAPYIGGTVKVNGMMRAVAGTGGKCLPPHIPIGGVFVKPPGNEAEMFMGSQTVDFDGDPASYMALPALSCHDVGMPSPPRLKKHSKPKSLELPTTVVLPIPAGPPVLIGGPPTINIAGMVMKLGLKGLGKAFKKLKASKLGQKFAAMVKKAKQKIFKNMKPGFLKCKVLKAEPVNIITGEVLFGATDFTLPGRVPLTWTRRYGSQQTRVGVCGKGWETPADARLEILPDGQVVFHDTDPGASVFDRIPPVNSVEVEQAAGAKLHNLAPMLVVRTRAGISYHFPLPKPGADMAWVNEIVDPCGNRIHFDRDNNGLRAIRWDDGRRIEVQSVGGRILRLTLYHPQQSEPIPLVRYDYGPDSDLIAVFDAHGNPHRFFYSRGRLVKHTDRAGLSFAYEYDGDHADSRCIGTRGDGGLLAYRFEYDPILSETRTIDSLGHITVTQYDEDQFPIAQIDSLGGVTQFAYNEAGRTSSMTTPDEKTTAWEFDDLGNLLKHTAPDGAETVFQYDEAGRPAGVVSPGGRTWRWQRDERGLVVSRTTPGGAEWRFSYSPQGDLTTLIDPLGAVTNIDWDPFGLPSAVFDGARRQSRVLRNALGRVTEVFHPDGTRVQMKYDVKGRLTELRRGQAPIHLQYDAADQMIAITDALGRKSTYDYIGLGCISARTDPDGTRIRYEYDTEERLIAVVNENARRWKVGYDALGRLAYEVDYWGAKWTYRYGADGHISHRIDPTGATTEFKFDAHGRLKMRKGQGTDPEKFTYDPDGRLLVGENGVSKFERAYDAAGRQIEEVQDGFRVVTEYDALGRTIRRRSDHANDVTFEWDLVGAIQAVSLNGKKIMEVQRDHGGRAVLQRFGNRLERTAAYDPQGDLLQQNLKASGRPVLTQDYRYDAAGAPTRLADNFHGEMNLERDARGRVVRSIVDGKSITYERAPDGSVLHESTTSTHTANGMGVVHQFDEAGRLIQRITDRAATRFQWDDYGRLTQAISPTGQTVRFGYDAIGRRVFKEVDGRVTRFRWNGDCILSDQAAEETPREFVFWPGSFVPLAVVEKRTLWFETGLAGIPQAACDENGQLAWSPTPDALAGVHSDRLDMPLRMQGQYFDAETSLCYHRHRYFDPAVGCFVSPDPLGLAAGTDVYGYAPDVWSWIDPFGLECWSFDRAVAFAREFYDRHPLLKRLSAIHRGELGATDRQMEQFAEILRRREGMDIVTHSAADYRARFGRGYSNAGTLEGNTIHMIEDVFSGPNGPHEIAHEYGAAKLFQEFGGRNNLPDVEGPMALTHILDSVGGF